MEKRYAPSGVNVEGRKLIGVGVPYNKPARVVVNGRTVLERFMPGAFKRTLAERRDVLMLSDHDPSKVLGRTRSGTLRLHEAADGLRFEVDLPDTTAARDALALAERGDTGGASVGFRATRETYNADKSERVIHEADLIEVSVIASHPAYDTTVQARAQETPEPLTARQRRLRLIEIGGAS